MSKRFPQRPKHLLRWNAWHIPMRQGFRGTLALDVPQREFQIHELSFHSLGTAQNGIRTVSKGRRDMVMMLVHVQKHMSGYL